MSVITKNPTSNTTPDPGQGGAAVTGNINTGHGSTTSSASAGGSQNKTCIWQSFTVASGQIQSIKLKWDWNISAGNADVTTNDIGDSADATITFKAEYSLNGGGAWNIQVNQSVQAIASGGGADSKTLTGSGSETVTLSVGQDLTTVRVRDSISVVTNRSGPGPNTCSGSISVSVSNIKIEITVVDQPSPVWVG